MGGAIVEDIRYDGGTAAPGEVEAYLVSPADAASRDPATCAGILLWHWLETRSPDGNRTQFLGEAGELAAAGVTSLLPQGRFPWTIDPTGSAADIAEIEREVARLRAGLDLLAARPEVDSARLAVVGHDFGGMLAILAAARDPRVRSLVVIAATPRWSDWFLPFWPIAEDRIEYLAATRGLDPIERIASEQVRSSQAGVRRPEPVGIAAGFRERDRAPRVLDRSVGIAEHSQVRRSEGQKDR
ncbi:MAG TPA: alpha/beta fold hydrolase, partial [Candidatus Limnocylindrales bacterium]|nr:alpha/beta fold hydrolase [Candidatus Limnocylindrales bacterium]